MGCIDKALKRNIFLRTPFLAALVAQIHTAHVHGVIAVEVGARSVLHHRSNPDGSETESLDVVEFINKPFEVTAPVGVIVGNLHTLMVPATHIVFGVTVVESRCHCEIDSLVAEIGATTHKSFCTTLRHIAHKNSYSGNQSHNKLNHNEKRVFSCY